MIATEPMETIHLYIVREEEKQPYTVFPLLCALLCLVGIVALTLYSAEHPYYEHERLTVSAMFLPLKVFRAEVLIISAGVKIYPATYAQWTLTLTNGLVLSGVLPKGVIFNGVNGSEVQTTESVFIPAGSASGYGVANIPARAVQAGKGGDIATFGINAVYGTALYVRNLAPFTGGRDAYSVTVQLPKDRLAAINVAKAIMAAQEAQIQAFLAGPCNETTFVLKAFIWLSWKCQFVTFKVPSYMHVSAARLFGKNFLVDVSFIPLLKPVRVK